MTGPFTRDVDTVAVIGDIGGQFNVFSQILAEVGMDPRSLLLPAGLGVVQVGDLIRAAGGDLDNDGCAGLAARVWAANPGRWVQLFGNHDLVPLGGPVRPAWAKAPPLAGATTDLLHDWWTQCRAVLAIALSTREYADVLITHAGLTRGRWKRIGTPKNPFSAAAVINADVGRPIHEVIHGGILTGHDPGTDAEDADVTWAEINTEFYGTWLAAGDDAPFSQIHGHASPWNWSTHTWWPDTPPSIRRITSVHPHVRRTVTPLARTDRHHPTATSVDWNLGNRPTRSTWPALMVTLRR